MDIKEGIKNKLVVVLLLAALVGGGWFVYSLFFHTVVFKVRGSNAGPVTVSISNPYLYRTIRLDNLPGEVKVAAGHGKYWNFVADFTSPGSVTCEIWVDGQLKETHTESHIHEIYGFGSCVCDVTLP